MTREELRDELEALRYPLYQQRSGEAMQRISYLFTKIAGRELRGNCYACHLDAFVELKGILEKGKAWDKTVTLAMQFINPQTEIKMSKLVKFEMIDKSKLVSIAGSSDFISIHNATDEKVEVLRKNYPATFAKYFKVREGVELEEAEKPKKLTAKQQAKLDAENAAKEVETPKAEGESSEEKESEEAE
jgi:hypothetical protein